MGVCLSNNLDGVEWMEMHRGQKIHEGINMKHAHTAPTNGIEPIVSDRALLESAFAEAEASAHIEGLTPSSLAFAQANLVIDGRASFIDAIAELKQRYRQTR